MELACGTGQDYIILKKKKKADECLMGRHLNMTKHHGLKVLVHKFLKMYRLKSFDSKSKGRL